MSSGGFKRGAGAPRPVKVVSPPGRPRYRGSEQLYVIIEAWSNFVVCDTHNKTSAFFGSQAKSFTAALSVIHRCHGCLVPVRYDDLTSVRQGINLHITGK